MTTILCCKMLVAWTILCTMVTASLQHDGQSTNPMVLFEDKVETMINQLMSEVKTIKSRNAYLEEHIFKLESKNSFLEGHFEDMSNTLKMLHAANKHLTKENTNIKNAISGIQHQLDSGLKSAQVDTLFLATLAIHENSIGPDDTIIWDTDIINPGGHFNTELGAYTAPYDGYYQFTVAVESDDFRAEFYFLIDDVRYAYHGIRTSEEDSSPSSSATITLELDAGQIIRVQNHGPTLIYGTHSSGVISSWFTGYLLYDL